MSSSGSYYDTSSLPLIRSSFPTILAKDMVSVQPMNLPSGLIFYMDYKYGLDELYKHPYGQLCKPTTD